MGTLMARGLVLAFASLEASTDLGAVFHALCRRPAPPGTENSFAWAFWVLVVRGSPVVAAGTQ